MRHALAGPSLIMCLGMALPAAAQNTPSREIMDQAQSVQAGKPEPAPDAALPPPSTKPDLVIAPIPLSNPAMGTGLAGAAVLYYNPNGSSRPWVSGFGGGYTSTDSWGLGASHNMTLADDRLRFQGWAGYGVANLRFYGIGANAGASNLSIKLRDKALAAMVDTQYQIFSKGFLRHLSFGARLYYLDMNARVSLPLPNHPNLTPPAIERHSQIAMLGPSFTFDSRNNPVDPRKGVYTTGSLTYGADWLGSDFTHHKLQIAGNGYFPLGRETVLVVRKTLCEASDGAPYYDLCLYGQNGDLRGYETGRYRDRASWALQGEVRQHLFGKIGMVAFGGIGGIARSVMTDSSVNPRIAIIPCTPAPRPAPSGRADNMRKRRSPGFWVFSPFCLHISPDG
ncbi:BamA/TamA family outer membrane protein, partial [Sphingobium yanoikuyae]|uniref:BamA/TamA family outer membrane protein n=1 Tax=Sphingobium yanoikuyae TaxID=13690 RepID=UPI001F45D5C9